MEKMKSWLLFLPLVRCDVLWNGFFDANFTVDHFDQWSWSNKIPPYQWYIHGSQPTPHYLGISKDFKNPASMVDDQGIRITIDETSSWNNQTMMRSEIIPQVTNNASLGQGHLYYHFSVSTRKTNAPDPSLEHQIAFFENHFTELKYGTISGTEPDNTLRWMVDRVTKWETPLVAGTWYNFAYDIDFDAKTVGLWASTGRKALKKVVENIGANVFTDSQDWHVGMLRLDNTKPGKAWAEDWFWSGVYIESGRVTTDVAGPCTL